MVYLPIATCSGKKKDTGLRAYFIGKISEAQEKDRAWDRYREMQNFVAAGTCRPKMICEHFGESLKWQQCGQCDACAGAPSWMASKTKSLSRRSDRAPSSKKTKTHEGGYSTVFGDDGVHPELQDFLREWRRHTAKEKGLAAFIVMHDTTLLALCRVQPETRQQLLQVQGMGEAKTKMYGDAILDALRRFRSGERARNDWQAQATSPARETLDLLQQGNTFEEIAQRRGRKVSTVVAMISSLIEKGETQFRPEWMDPAHYSAIQAACTKLGTDLLSPVKNSLPPEISYEEVRLVVAHLRINSQKRPVAD
jgi:DNA-binding CsgD family transcriptional regulator